MSSSGRSSSVDRSRSGSAAQSSQALFQRSVEHLKRRKEWLAQEAAAKKAQELDGCTFAPRINAKSRRIGASRRYRSASPKGSVQSQLSRLNPHEMSEDLHEGPWKHTYGPTGIPSVVLPSPTASEASALPPPPLSPAALVSGQYALVHQYRTARSARPSSARSSRSLSPVEVLHFVPPQVSIPAPDKQRPARDVDTQQQGSYAQSLKRAPAPSIIYTGTHTRQFGGGSSAFPPSPSPAPAPAQERRRSALLSPGADDDNRPAIQSAKRPSLGDDGTPTAMELVGAALGLPAPKPPAPETARPSRPPAPPKRPSGLSSSPLPDVSSSSPPSPGGEQFVPISPSAVESAQEAGGGGEGVGPKQEETGGEGESVVKGPPRPPGPPRPSANGPPRPGAPTPPRPGAPTPPRPSSSPDEPSSSPAPVSAPTPPRPGGPPRPSPSGPPRPGAPTPPRPGAPTPPRPGAPTPPRPSAAPSPVAVDAEVSVPPAPSPPAPPSAPRPGAPTPPRPGAPTPPRPSPSSPSHITEAASAIAAAASAVSAAISAVSGAVPTTVPASTGPPMPPRPTPRPTGGPPRPPTPGVGGGTGGGSQEEEQETNEKLSTPQPPRPPGPRPAARPPTPANPGPSAEAVPVAPVPTELVSPPASPRPMARPPQHPNRPIAESASPAVEREESPSRSRSSSPSPPPAPPLPPAPAADTLALLDHVKALTDRCLVLETDRAALVVANAAMTRDLAEIRRTIGAAVKTADTDDMQALLQAVATTFAENGRLKQDLKQAQSSMAGLESERKKWLSQLELENSQLKQLFDDAKRAKEQLVLELNALSIDRERLGKEREEVESARQEVMRMLTGVNRSGGEPGGGVSVAQVSRVLSSMDGSLYPKMSMAAVSTPSIRPSPAPAPAAPSPLPSLPPMLPSGKAVVSDPTAFVQSPSQFQSVFEPRFSLSGGSVASDSMDALKRVAQAPIPTIPSRLPPPSQPKAFFGPDYTSPVPSPRSSSLGFDSGSRRDNSVASFPSYAEDTKSVAKLDSELEALKKELDALRSKRS